MLSDISFPYIPKLCYVERVHLFPIFPIPEIQFPIIDYYNNKVLIILLCGKVELLNPTTA